MPQEQIEIRTEEINDILGKSPNKFIRWGIGSIFMIIMALLTGSWFFKYPDFVTSTIEITTHTPPAEIVANANGKLIHLFVSDNEKVYSGSDLAVIENPAHYNDMKKLRDYLKSIKEDIPRSNMRQYPSWGNNLAIGEIQPYLSEFLSSLKHFLNYKKINYHTKKIAALNKEIDRHERYKYYNSLQKETLAGELELKKKEYRRYQKLYKQTVVAESELEKVKSQYLQTRYSLQGAISNLANLDIQITALKNNIVELQLQDQQQGLQLLQKLQESFDNLYSQISAWEQRYVLKAPIDGICSFTKFWTENQNVRMGENVLSVIPEGEQEIIGRVLLPVQGAGKVKTGQKVNIKLLNYPYMEYGMLLGYIKNISLVPSENYYAVEVHFPDGIQTNYGKAIEFQQKMQGSAEIITEDIRLLVRIMTPVRSLLKNRSFKKLNLDEVFSRIPKSLRN